MGYEVWRKRAIQEAKKKYPGAKVYEVCEDGSVYLGDMIWFPKNTVEAWQG